MYANVEESPSSEAGAHMCLLGRWCTEGLERIHACGGYEAGCQARFRTGKEFPTPNIPGSLAVGRIHICPGQSRMEPFFFKRQF